VSEAPATVVSLHRQLGLTDDEYARIEEILGRKPNHAELAMYSVMWSEHCSYKSSKIYLRTLPSEGPQVLIGPGEGAEMVQPRDEQALAEALDRLLADGALRDGYAERNLRIVRERVAESAPAMEALYRRLISEHAERSAGPVS